MTFQYLVRPHAINMHAETDCYPGQASGKTDLLLIASSMMWTSNWQDEFLCLFYFIFRNTGLLLGVFYSLFFFPRSLSNFEDLF